VFIIKKRIKAVKKLNAITNDTKKMHFALGGNVMKVSFFPADIYRNSNKNY